MWLFGSQVVLWRPGVTKPNNRTSAVHWQFGILFFQVFGRFPAKLGPKTPLERRGSSCSAGCTKNQPRRPILRPFRGNLNSDFTPSNEPLRHVFQKKTCLLALPPSAAGATKTVVPENVWFCWPWYPSPPIHHLAQKPLRDPSDTLRYDTRSFGDLQFCRAANLGCSGDFQG